MSERSDDAPEPISDYDDQRSADESDLGFSASPQAKNPLSLRSLLPSGRFPGQEDIQFRRIAYDAKQSTAGDLAIYRIGKDCPSRVVADATARGASGILTEQVLPSPIPQCIVGDVELALATLTAAVTGRPDRKLLNIGVIGSAGKTSSTLLIASLLRSSGIRTAYWNDLGDSDGIVQSTPKSSIPTGSKLVNWLKDAVDNQCAASVIEISEEMARHGKYDAIEFDMIVVTGSESRTDDFGPQGLQSALECLTATGVVIAPADDPRTLRTIRGTGLRLVTYGVRKAADVTAKIIEQVDGLSTLVVSHRETSAVMETTLCGAAMAANHAAASVVGILLDRSLPEIVEQLSQLTVIPGRGQRLSQWNQPTVILESGGNVDRITQALRTHHSMKAKGKLWCVFAITERFSSQELADGGAALERFADRMVITSTPRAKVTFLAKSHEVLDGVQKCAAFRLVADRSRAIDWVLQEASEQDTVVIFTNETKQTAHEQRSDLRRLRFSIEQNWKIRKANETAPPKTTAPNLSIFG